MSGGEASKILNFLKETEEWRENGFELKRPVILLQLDEPKRGKRKTEEPGTAPKPEGRTHYEIVQVRPQVAAELFEVLQTNEIRLREMAVWEEEDRKQRLVQLVELILSWPMKDELESIDGNRGS